MRRIYTLTGNSLAEQTLTFAKPWEAGGTFRAAEESFQVGGKGFNVAKMLHRLNAPVTALGFVGGAVGDACRAWFATQAHYAHHLFATTVPTRSGIVVRAPGRPEATFLAPDRAVDGAALRACVDYLNTLPKDVIVALCGSFPGWSGAQAEPLRERLAHLARQGQLVVDTYGPPLADLVQLPTRLVKINRTEFEALWGQPGDPPTIEGQLREALQRWPVSNWIITDGPRPVWWASAEGVACAKPPAVAEVSATGSGDVFFAAVLATWFLRLGSLEEAIASALPLAALNAASPGVADFSLPASSVPAD